MTHKISIWSKRKEDGRGFIIETRLTVTEDMLLEWATEKYEDEHEYSLSTNRVYYALLDSTTHD